jgi:hypothetical protein
LAVLLSPAYDSIHPIHESYFENTIEHIEFLINNILGCRMNLSLVNDWEYNVLGILNSRKAEALRFYFEFIKYNHLLLEGDIVESGVYQGKSLLGTALILKVLGSSKKVYGYDSFSGFPPVYDENDKFERFDDLLEAGRITEEHYQDVKKNLKWRTQLSGSSVNPGSISGFGDFSLTSRDLVEKKIEVLGLDNVVLVDGPFDQTMIDGTGPQKIMCALMDCDLYQSYVTTFDFVWPRLVERGLIYLDEYYSLKFPGARIGTDEFVKSHDGAELERFQSDVGEFERWGLWKRY